MRKTLAMVGATALMAVGISACGNGAGSGYYDGYYHNHPHIIIHHYYHPTFRSFGGRH